MNRKTFWLSIILIFAACASVLFMISRDDQTPSLQKKPGGMNAFMTNATYTQFDKLGQIHTRIKTPNMQHYTEKDTSFFIKPAILIYTNDRIPWHITSDYGKSQNGTTTVYLWSNVVLHQPQLENHPETTILTSAMTLYPKRSFAKTDRKVTIHRPDSVIKGIGVTANFKTGIIKLLTHSRGIYEPEKK